ncbi:hypothetical protein N5D52_25155 [Pseudomonas sp. GD03860]|uniref:hypothetical protein n=1 Tax=Pseudomonas TaxID=286 RepID=UPI0023638D5F|nr:MULTISPECIES: hypothetical protein [Pseudomonas]MDD2058410.1 hypothetical protein [Pseudomonas putida]MDH0640222.1 hypothetical protein [Pseudomonas sp. GD03860]
MKSPAQPSIALSPMAVGRYFDAQGERQALMYSSLEVERSTRSILRVLNTFDFHMGSNLMITALFDQGVQALGMERAVMQFNMVAVSADSSLFDARRVESIIRRFHLVGAYGITAATLDGLVGLGHDPLQLFAGMVVWAWPDAYERLAGQPGLRVLRCLELGPAVAIECSAGAGAHIDRFEWAVDAIDGEVVLSSRLDRCQPFHHYHTGLRGQVLHGACSCGSADPRVVPA